MELRHAEGKRGYRLEGRRLQNGRGVDHTQEGAHYRAEYDAQQQRHAAPDALAIALDQQDENQHAKAEGEVGNGGEGGASLSARKVAQSGRSQAHADERNKGAHHYLREQLHNLVHEER